MGTWGEGNFENDSAMDVIDELIANDTLKPLNRSFRVVQIESIIVSIMRLPIIQVDTAQEAIAAAEVVALLKGNPAEDLPERLLIWHQTRQLKADKALVKKAIRAVETVTSNASRSELVGLWEDGQNALIWRKNIDDLLARLCS